MFHAFRCVLDCWKLCASVFGLGFNSWCNLFLARHMFMHISCIHTISFLSICSIVTVFCLFLSLLDRLRLAPKRKSNLTQNPFHSSPSLSSNLPVPPFHVQFRDEKAHQDFFENFSKCGVHPEHYVILLDFSNTPLSDVIHTRGWESLWKITLWCLIVFIQEFYSNMHGIDTSIPQFTMVLQGTHIVVTSDLVSEILHVLWVAHPDYLGC